MVLLGAIITTQIVALIPSSLEEGKSTSIGVDPDLLVQDDEPTLVPGIPKNRIPEYSIEQFHYVSLQDGQKLWRVEARKAFLYNPERLSHSRGVTAYLYDPEGKITKVTSNEARYFMNKKDLELYGKVKTIFPDGFELDSEYMKYKPNNRHIEIPTEYLAHGIGSENEGQRFSFISKGLDYTLGEPLVHLKKEVKVTLEKLNSPNDKAHGVPDVTTIESDHCLIDRSLSLAFFTMNPKRPLKSRFVYITQPTLYSRARRADLNYGDFSKVLQYIVAYEDVFIKDKGEDQLLRYATGGRADFDTKEDIVKLTQFPQAYQSEDTVTGDVIIMHRDTDIIEVEHSNAFSSGMDK